jgi:hypothetical protein
VDQVLDLVKVVLQLKTLQVVVVVVGTVVALGTIVQRGEAVLVTLVG